MDLFYVVFGLALLVGAGDALVRGAVALSLRFGLPPFIVSATIVAIGTSAPEMLISIKAALEGAPGIAMGNVVGSNTANVLLVLGLPALIAPMAGCGDDAHRNLWIMIGASLLFMGLCLGGVIGLIGGLALMGVAIGMVVDSTRMALRTREIGGEPDIREEAEHLSPLMTAVMMGAGLLGLPLGADFLVTGARGIALDVGVSEAVIGLTVVAIGTSLPELATTMVAAIKRKSDVAIGNVIGSNIFNVTAVAGVAAIVAPITVPTEILARDLWFMLGATALLVPFVLMDRAIGRITGLGFVIAYVAYLWVAFH